MDRLQAVRAGKWKLHVPGKRRRAVPLPPQLEHTAMLFDLEADLAETTDLAEKHPEVVRRLEALAKKAREDLGDADRPGKNQRPAGHVADPKPQVLRTRQGAAEK